MANPLVSVVIPSYNRPERTQRAINSVAAQTYGPIELLVVDDGSTPPVEEELTLPNEDLYRTELLTHEENRGANVARNTGINAATGEYIAFLDSDDEWEVEKLARQMDVLNGKNKTVSYTGIKHIDENGQLNSISRATLSGDLSDQLLRDNVIGTFSSVVVPANLIDVTGPPDPELPSYQDWEWYLRVSEHATFKSISDPLTVKHSDSEQISDDFRQKYKQSYPILKARLSDRAQDEQMEQIALSGVQFRMGYSALSNGKYSFARRFFAESIRTNPKLWRSYIYLLLSGTHIEIFRRIKRTTVRIRN